VCSVLGKEIVAEFYSISKKFKFQINGVMATVADMTRSDSSAKHYT
jgi:hypothetical protein